MSAIIKKFVIFFLVTAVVLNAGCFHQGTPVDKLYTVLDNVAAAEKGFEEQQQPLVALEKQEKVTYEQIIGLGMKQYDQVDKLSDEALKIVNARKKYMDKETQSIKNSEKDFQKVAYIKDKISDPVLKKMANQLYGIMKKRYQAHDDLYKEYTKGLNYDKQLYRMLKNNHLPIENLELQITKINNTYEKIYSANQNFNKFTEEFNNQKLLFYKEAGFNVAK